MLNKETALNFKNLFITVFLLIFACFSSVNAEVLLRFGTLPIAEPHELLNRYTPLINYLKKETGYSIKLEIGRSYSDSINKFISGYFDFGFLGPAPYIIATRNSKNGKDNFKLMGTLETEGKPYYRSVIVAGKNNKSINSIEDLEGKTFGFGSRKSTLAFYMPAKMLIENDMMSKLKTYKFLGKHDVVINMVGSGFFDAGGVKESIALSHLDKIKIVGHSEDVWDFMILAHKKMHGDVFSQLRKAVLKLKDKTVLEGLKKRATGFVPATDSNYDNLRMIMNMVDEKCQ